MGPLIFSMQERPDWTHVQGSLGSSGSQKDEGQEKNLSLLLPRRTVYRLPG